MLQDVQALNGILMIFISVFGFFGALSIKLLLSKLDKFDSRLAQIVEALNELKHSDFAHETSISEIKKDVETIKITCAATHRSRKS